MIGNRSGFTLVEVLVALGLAGLLALAVGEITVGSKKSEQSNEAEEEFNSEMALVLTVVNATIPAITGGQSGCSSAFTGMTIVVGALPVIPQPIPEIDMAFGAIPPNPLMKVTLLPLAVNAINHLQIVSMNFTAVIDSNFITPPPAAQAASTIYLLNLEIKATKIAAFNSTVQFGGLTAFDKNILIPLWINSTTNIVTGCVS